MRVRTRIDLPRCLPRLEAFLDIVPLFSAAKSLLGRLGLGLALAFWATVAEHG